MVMNVVVVRYGWFFLDSAVVVLACAADCSALGSRFLSTPCGRALPPACHPYTTRTCVAATAPPRRAFALVVFARSSRHDITGDATTTLRERQVLRIVFWDHVVMVSRDRFWIWLPVDADAWKLSEKR